MMGGGEPTRTETIRQTTMPTEIIQKTITIEGDGNQLTAEELRDIISKHAGDLSSSEVVTTVRCGHLLHWTLVGVVHMLQQMYPLKPRGLQYSFHHSMCACINT